MKHIKIKSRISGILFFLSGILFFSSCEIEELINPNGPDLEVISSDATIGEIVNLASGVESGMRERLNTYYDGVGVIGREIYRFSGSDPRFTSDLLGKGSAFLDDNTFYTTRPFEARYRVIKNCNILIEAVTNSTADISEAQRNGVRGYAKTIIAYQLLLNLNMQYENGVRTDVSDPDNLGPFTSSYSAGLAAIADLLEEAKGELDGAGTELLIQLSSGFEDYDDVAGFRQVNRAIAARVALYRSNYADALTYLDESFFSITGDLNEGVFNIYSAAGGDLLNEMFFPANSSPGGNARVAQPDFITDAETGDLRLSKVLIRDETAFQDDLSSDYDFWVYKTDEDPIPIIRNEELILIYAEANIQESNMSDAVIAIDRIRIAAGLPGYMGPMTKDDLIDEMLHQRRYSLYGEGHRWVDMRRYNRLDQLPIDRPDDDVWIQFPRPATEG